MNHTRYFIGPRMSVQFHTILAKAEIQQVTIAAGGKAGHEFNRYPGAVPSIFAGESKP
jgi:hypothetical protein